jgi:tetratricopeptide (TPR) repeat protein
MADWEESFRRAAESHSRGDLPGVAEHLQAALAAMPGDTPLADRAAVLNNLGHASAAMKDFQGALAAFGEAADLFGSAGEPGGRAEQIMNTGSVYRDMGDHARALEAYLCALELHGAAGVRLGVADQYANIGYACAMLGDKARAREAFSLARGEYEDLGETEKALLAARNIEKLA